MFDDPETSGEDLRLKALRAYCILDSAPEQSYDDITQLAAFICQTPIALVSLVDESRQWFKSRVGLDVTETPRDIAFCDYAIRGERTMVVEDAACDSRFAVNPLVKDNPGIRFYAGAPLQTPEGLGLGTLCVIDRQPRNLKASQIEALESLARLVVTQLELRRISTDLAVAQEDIRTLRGLVPICSYCKSIRDDEGYWQRVDTFVEAHTHAEFSHGICPGCVTSLYPDLAAAPMAN